MIPLKADNIGWAVHGKPIIQSISLDVEEGEVLGLVGPNGSGKSTLIRVLAGLRKPSTGMVTLNGTPLRKMNRRTVAQMMAVVEQHADTGDALTARDAVKIGRTPWLSPLEPWDKDDDEIVETSLRDVGMLDKAGQSWRTLSGGERQRVHIARALAQRPKIMLLDEPTNHLDIHHQLSILQLIQRLGRTTVIALHDLNQALGCDRVAVLHRGRLVAIGAPDHVITERCLTETFAVSGSFLTDPADGSRIIRFN
ncbi:MAG: ABC transporter ATP-binding protein [Pseudomonadota bacterium]